ncbi:hypothetical protein MS3_00001458 [Schistosoma haematobium]|uniref:Uncharacterized protein n=1 Tax=Schistosoma haematobium TaxID=6185 RepID=A0A922S5X9_SCHHA|nr:hypothetical protein MS3_00001458 [Schistosoma haematobium]KAH9595396.1 hypothetical protein MS3_00001458 [Schistosoma haematobium]
MLKYLTSVQLVDSTELVDRNSISNISTTTSRSTEQHHQVNRSRFLAMIVINILMDGIMNYVKCCQINRELHNIIYIQNQTYNAVWQLELMYVRTKFYVVTD